MLKLTYTPVGNEKKGKVKEIPTKDGEDFAIEKHGVRYTDPASGLIFMELYDRLEKVELVMDVSPFMKRYAKAFQVVNSDGNTPRGVSPIEQMKLENDISAARKKVNG